MLITVAVNHKYTNNSLFWKSHFHVFHFKLPWPWQPCDRNYCNNWAKASAEVFNSQCMVGLSESVWKCHIFKWARFWRENPWHSSSFQRGSCQKKRLGTTELDSDGLLFLLPYSVKLFFRMCSSYLVTKETAGLCSSKLLRPGLWVNKSHGCLEWHGKYWKGRQEEFISTTKFKLLQ